MAPAGLLPVPDVLPAFPPVRWAAAYGSAALQQAGYSTKNNSMVDYIFAVDSPADWHRGNIAANPSHYSSLKWLGAGVVGHVQEKWASGVYYNTLIDWEGEQRIKYGVVSVNKLVEDLTEWRHMYLAGRLHKPVITLQADEEIEAAVQVNLDRALDASRLLLPAEFSKRELFRSAAGLSYLGDYRMQFGENPKKVHNIVDPNIDAFTVLYAGALARAGLRVKPAGDAVGVTRIAGPTGTATRTASVATAGSGALLQQDTSVAARESILRRLPVHLQQKLLAHAGIAQRSGSGSSSTAVAADLQKLGRSAKLRESLTRSVGDIVRQSSKAQSVKALATAGFIKCGIYLMEKLNRTSKARGSQ
jgi:mitochondrial translocator assembly and maintenance protein 41